MVYVELRALRGDDWSNNVSLSSTSFEADKNLTHMPTPEMNALSYAPLSKLGELVRKNWTCYAPYLPPQDLWEAKLKEISQIRHRIAHFRSGHTDDHARILQFLRDIDKGFWTFCTSYNNAQPVLPQSDDLVTSHFLNLDPLPWMEIEPRKWARVGLVDQSLIVGMTVNVQRRPWAKSADRVDGSVGFLYDFRLSARGQRMFDYPRLLEATRNLHSHLVHICLDASEDAVRLTIPAILGSSKVIEIVERVVEASEYNISSHRNPIAPTPDLLADEWPEYVLGPTSPLTFLDPEMKCSFFGA